MDQGRQHTTLLDLVQRIQGCTQSDAEVVAIVAHLVNSGQVTLRGIFAGRCVVVD